MLSSLFRGQVARVVSRHVTSPSRTARANVYNKSCVAYHMTRPTLSGAMIDFVVVILLPLIPGFYIMTQIDCYRGLTPEQVAADEPTRTRLTIE